MAKFEVVGDIERNGKTFTVLKGIRGTVFSDKDADEKFKDLDGDYFHKSTWFGDDYAITRKFLMYDHGQNDLTNEYPIPDPIIGVAEFKFADDVARWFEIELDKANVMYPAIMELNNLGLLGASSRTLPGKGILVKSADGALDRWPEVELSLCTVPADARTRYEESDLVTLKSVLSKYLPRVEKQAPQEDTKKDGHLYMSIDAELDNASAMDVVDAAVKAAADADSPSSEQSLEDKLLELLETALNPWKAALAASDEKIKALEAKNEDLEKSIGVLKDHLVGVKKDIAKSGAEWLLSLRGGAKDAAQDILNKTESKTTTPPPVVTPPSSMEPKRAFAGRNAPGSH